MTTRTLALAPRPGFGASVDQKIEWCVDSIHKIALWANEAPVTTIVQNFSAANVTEARTFDADTASAGDLADVLGTLIGDLSKGGAKRR